MIGISLRLIREYDAAADRMVVRPIDVALVSCALLGHTWRINAGELFCGVCGAPNLALKGTG